MKKRVHFLIITVITLLTSAGLRAERFPSCDYYPRAEKCYGHVFAAGSIQSAGVYKRKKNGELEIRKGFYLFHSGDFYVGNWDERGVFESGFAFQTHNKLFRHREKQLKSGGKEKSVELASKLPYRVSPEECESCFGRVDWGEDGVYIGEFRNGEPDGFGFFLLTTGHYIGDVKNSNIHGKGTYSFTNGDEYVGSFREHLFHGKGKLTFANGEVYEGSFVNGGAEGYAYKKSVDKKVWVGLFHKNKKVPSEGKWYASKSEYEEQKKLNLWRLQTLLTNQGYLEGSPDGLFGPNTFRAVRGLLGDIGSEDVTGFKILNRLEWDPSGLAENFSSYFIGNSGDCNNAGRVIPKSSENSWEICLTVGE